MKEHTTRLSRSLIVGHGRDGRCLYDPEAKRELVKICLQPGISVAKVALEHGINANLLRKWLGVYREKTSSVPNRSAALPVFAPVIPLATPKLSGSSLSVALSNGVKLELSSVALSDLPLILNALAELPCSASNRD
jgi:transposase